VAFIENVASQCTTPVNHQLFVKTWNASASRWDAVGGGKVPTASGRSIPSVLSLWNTGGLTGEGGLYDVAVEAGAVYVAYVEREAATSSYHLVLKRWSGTSWIQVGGTINGDTSVVPQDPELRFLPVSGTRTPHLAWRDGGHLRMKRVHVDDVIASGNLLGPLSTWEWVGAQGGDLGVTATGRVATLSLTGTTYPVIAWTEQGSATRTNGAGRALSCSEVFVKRFDPATSTWRLWASLSFAGASGAIERACGDYAPFIDVGIGMRPPGLVPYVATALTDFDNGGYTPTMARVRVQSWRASQYGWRDVGAPIDLASAHAEPATEFFRAALAFSGNGRPWVGWIRHQPLPYLQAPYGVVRPADQLLTKAFE
jgi:hypothetical protein